MSNTLKPQAMKRLLTIGLMLASVFALTNCSEQIVTPEKEPINVDGNIENNTAQEGLTCIPYAVYVNEPGTKTIASGGNTYWVDEATALANGLDKDAVDRVTIYTMDADSKYTCHGKYTYAGNKKFVGDLYGQTGEISNWYCLYPYVSSVAATGKDKIEETLIFGASAESNYTQIQYGENNMDHIAGKNYPMYGTTTENNRNAPTFTMNHLSSLVEIKLVNETGNPVKIEQIELIAKEKPIVGEFKYTLSEGSTLISDLKNGKQSKTAILKLGENGAGALISAGATSMFYLGVAPVEDVFTIRINGTAIANDTAIKLQSGKKTTLKVTIPKLTGTQTMNTKANGVELVAWSNTIQSPATINGQEGLQVYTVTDGIITIQGRFADFLGQTEKECALPLAFYAASKMSKNQNGVYEEKMAKLEVESVKVYADVNMNLIITQFNKAITFEFDGKQLSENMGGMRVGFDLNPIGNFSDNNNNLIVLDDAANYYYIDESKANSLIYSALADEDGKIKDENGNEIVGGVKVDDFRKVLYEGDADGWNKLILLAKKLAPGQFVEGNSLGQLLGYVPSLDDNTRKSLGSKLGDGQIIIKLKSTGEAVCWGLNVQSKAGDYKPKTQN